MEFLVDKAEDAGMGTNFENGEVEISLTVEASGAGAAEAAGLDLVNNALAVADLSIPLLHLDKADLTTA